MQGVAARTAISTGTIVNMDNMTSIGKDGPWPGDEHRLAIDGIETLETVRDGVVSMPKEDRDELEAAIRRIVNTQRRG